MSITIAEIQEAVASHFGIDRAHMKSQRRAVYIARPRQVAMYLCKKLTARSYPEIARLFGNRDHTTVMHAHRRIRALRLEDENFDHAVASIARKITSQHTDKLNNELLGWMA